MKNKTDKDLSEFVEELAWQTTLKFGVIREELKDCIVGITLLPPEIKKEDWIAFGLNEDIELNFQYNRLNGWKTLFLYKGYEVKPDCYFIKPVNYTPVETIDVLRECIKQDKYNPDIRDLEKC